jgi:hypothetical protein
MSILIYLLSMKLQMVGDLSDKLIRIDCLDYSRLNVLMMREQNTQVDHTLSRATLDLAD